MTNIMAHVMLLRPNLMSLHILSHARVSSTFQYLRAVLCDLLEILFQVEFRVIRVRYYCESTELISMWKGSVTVHCSMPAQFLLPVPTAQESCTRVAPSDLPPSPLFGEVFSANLALASSISFAFRSYSCLYAAVLSFEWMACWCEKP